MTLEAMLRRMGYHAAGSCSSADEAIRAVGESMPDLILMDIRLRGDKDGISAAEEIHRRYQVPVVYLTAHSDKNTLERAKKTLPYGYLTKPVRERDLYSAIEIALFKHRLITKERGETGVFCREPASPSAQPEASPPKDVLFPPFLGQLVLDCLDSPVFVLDPDGRLVYFNEALKKLMISLGDPVPRLGRPVSGQELAVFLERSPAACCQPDRAGPLREERTVRAGTATATFLVERRIVPTNPAGRYTSFTLHDISQEKRHEKRAELLWDAISTCFFGSGKIIRDDWQDGEDKKKSCHGTGGEISR